LDGIHRHALAGAKTLVELEIDLRDDVVGIEFFQRGVEMRGGLFNSLARCNSTPQKSRLRE
jgi:hypothetical protein